MKKLFKIFTLVLLLSLTFTLAGCKKENDVEGTITVIVVDKDAKELFNDDITFTAEDNYVDLLEKNSDIKMKGEIGDYGYYITSMCDLEASNESQTYWAIYVNDEYGLVGISDMVLVDKDVVKFALESW